MLEEYQRQLGSPGYGRMARTKTIDGDEWMIATDQDTFEIVLKVEWGYAKVNQANNLIQSKSILHGQLTTTHRQIMKNLRDAKPGPRFDEWTKQRLEIEDQLQGVEAQLADLKEIVSGATAGEFRYPKHLEGVTLLIG